MLHFVGGRALLKQRERKGSSAEFSLSFSFWELRMGRSEDISVNRTKQNKRATIEDISSITLPELSKYFDVPIAEASRHLNVGQTVLKRKCREFGIPRWPHRKIKSLDTLIQDLQVVVEERRGQDESAAAAEKQRLLEMEKQSIKKDPVMDLQSETKRFRQDIFKRRHRLKALGQQSTEEAAMGDDLLYFVRSVNPTTAAKREDAQRNHLEGKSRKENPPRVMTPALS